MDSLVTNDEVEREREEERVYECFGTMALRAHAARRKFESSRERTPIVGVLREREVTTRFEKRTITLITRARTTARG